MKAKEFIKSKGWVENSLLSQEVVVELMNGFAKAKLEEASENFENEIGLKSDYFNHRLGMFNAVKKSIKETPLD